MPERHHGPDAPSEKARRREARAVVGAYHQEQLRALLEHVRKGFGQLDAGEIDEFELDDLIHRYKRAAKKLWLFCGSSGGQWLQAATALAYMRDRGEEHDWWAESARRRDETSTTAPLGRGAEMSSARPTMSRVASPPARCGMCQQVRAEGVFDDSGVVFICVLASREVVEVARRSP